MKLLEGILMAMVVERPTPAAEERQHLCMDKGYEYPQVRQLLDAWGQTARVQAREQEALKKFSAIAKL